MINIGDVVNYNGVKVKITEVSYTNNGYGFEYLEGPKKGWMDWTIATNPFEAVKDDEMNK